MRVGIEYISTGQIRITTPYRQKTVSLTKHRSTFHLDFQSLQIHETIGFGSSGTKIDTSVVFRWDANDHELLVKIGDDMVKLPTQTRNIIISVV